MKVVFFFGREHHILKLKSVYDALKDGGVDVLGIYSTNSINIDPTSEYIWRYDVEHRHLHDYLDGDIAREIEEVSEHPQRYSLFPDLNQHIAPFWISHSVREASETLALGKRMFERESPDAFVALHANNCWTRPLLYLAQERGIKTYAFQEGLLRHRDQETMNKQFTSAEFVDTLFTWSQSDMAAYVGSGVKESIVKPVGPTHLDGYIGIRSDNRKLQETKQQFASWSGMRFNPALPTVTFAPPLISRYQGNFERAITELSSYCKKNGIQLVVRLHPFDYKATGQVKKMAGGALFYEKADIIPLVVVSNLVISQHSTTGVEALYLGTLFAELDLDNVGILQSMDEAIHIGNGELNKIAGVLDGDPGVDIDRLNSWLRTNASLCDNRATERVVNIIKERGNG